MPIPPIEVRTLPLAQLTPSPYNPRKVLKPTDAAYRKLRASLVEFGLVEPLVWNETTGHVVGGHARLKILHELGVTEVPVSVVRLDSTREKALNVVLNNQEAQGRYDPTKLRDLLLELHSLSQLSLSGFDEAMLSNLQLEPVGELPPDDRDADRVEVVLVFNRNKFLEVEPQLDELVRSWDVEVHVKR